LATEAIAACQSLAVVLITEVEVVAAVLVDALHVLIPTTMTIIAARREMRTISENSND
jgi:hypothetical protein